MKKITTFICVLFIATMLSACGYQKVPAGYEGVKINTLGSGKGAITTLGVGRHFFSPKYETELFPLFKQNYVWTRDPAQGSPNNESISFQSSESLVFNADVGISYSVIPKRGKDLYVSYHKGIEEITDIDMRNSIASLFNTIGSQRSVEEVYGKGKSKFIEIVFKTARDNWRKEGIEIHKIYLVSAIRPPSQVRASISKKIEATQIALQRQNEIKTATAEANKKIETARGESTSKKLRADGEAYSIITKAKAEAEGIDVITKQLGRSPKYIEYIKVKRWNGALPRVVTGNSTPMISISGK